MRKEKILNLFSSKQITSKYERSLFLRKSYYKLVPFILGFLFISIFFWPSIYSTHQKKEIVLENKKTKF